MKTGLRLPVLIGVGLAKSAGTMYLKFYMGGLYGSRLAALNTMKMINLGAAGKAVA